MKKANESKRISVEVTPEMVKWLEKQAIAYAASLSWVVRRSIKENMDSGIYNV